MRSTRLRVVIPALFLLVSAFTVTSCRDKGAEALGIRLKLEQTKLPNGLTVLIAEDHTVPVVSYQSWYRVGSVDERPGITGISHLFEHLMFKGTPKYGAKQFFNELEAKGAEVNAYTTRDYTVYYANFVPTLLEKVIDMESDRMTNLKLDEEVMNSEKQVVLEERKMRTDNSPEGRMQEALWGLAFKRHPYRWPVIGSPEDVISTQLSDLIAYYRSHYQPGNAILVIAGDVDTQKTLELIRKYYGPLEGQGRPARDIPKEWDQKEERRMELTDETASERLLWGYHVTSATDDDSYALDVLSNILFEGTSSRGYQRLVEEKDLAAGVSGSDYTPTYPGLFIINATMKGGVPASSAESELQKLIEDVQENGVKTEEISRAVKQLTVQLVDSVRTSYGLGQLLGIVTTVFGDPKRFYSDLSKYTEVTQADVKRVAQKYLVPNNRSVVVLRPVVKAAAGGSESKPKLTTRPTMKKEGAR